MNCRIVLDPLGNHTGAVFENYSMLSMLASGDVAVGTRIRRNEILYKVIMIDYGERNGKPKRDTLALKSEYGDVYVARKNSPPNIGYQLTKIARPTIL